jgi:hypothetical protein
MGMDAKTCRVEAASILTLRAEKPSCSRILYSIQPATKYAAAHMGMNLEKRHIVHFMPECGQVFLSSGCLVANPDRIPFLRLLPVCR